MNSSYQKLFARTLILALLIFCPKGFTLSFSVDGEAKLQRATNYAGQIQLGLFSWREYELLTSASYESNDNLNLYHHMSQAAAAATYYPEIDPNKSELTISSQFTLGLGLGLTFLKSRESSFWMEAQSIFRVGRMKTEEQGSLDFFDGIANLNLHYGFTQKTSIFTGLRLRIGATEEIEGFRSGLFRNIGVVLGAKVGF